ncbi:MAG TPA: long-chain fatty acid--CoA ligase [Streptosporangiaceae bacterium]|jgi:long-chain acyl-CoA synthetase|nr:long-chain fatty acid--CoA ligase [Streptosporangiaceae bacterium]
MTNLAEAIQIAQAAHGERLALRQGDQALTYAELVHSSGQAAALVRDAGVATGGRVALMMPNVLAYPVLFYGILAAGAVVVPMNPLLKSREVAHYLGDSGASVIFAWDGAAEEAAKAAADLGVQVIRVSEPDAGTLLRDRAPAAEWAVRNDDDTAVILYTSGTTGLPKGAELTHSNLFRNAEVTARTLLKASDGDVVMGCLPLFHCFGLTCGLNASVLRGACLTLLPRFDPGAALDMIGRERVTIFEGVPTMYSAMLNHPARESADVSSLRLCVSGGAALPVEVLRRFEDAFGCAILEGYGLSETSPVASFNHPDRDRKPGSIGTPVSGVQMRVVDDAGAELPAGDVGEIAIRGHNVMKGYWGNRDATRTAIPDGWFRTGDLAKVDDEGYFFIVDRKKELIIRGGYNVYPREVEEALYEHPSVAEVAVVGIPHESLGEEIGAAVALKPGMTATPGELSAFAKERVAAYKYPRQVWLVDTLPKGPTGKILRREVHPPAPDSTTGEPAAARETS